MDKDSGGHWFTGPCKNEHFSEATVKIFIAEIVLAVEHRHRLGIIYRDIKLENILLHSQGHLILSDFGLRKILSSESDCRAYSFSGTVEYMAPEVICAVVTSYNRALDWWSIEALTYELLNEVSPFTVEQQNVTCNKNKEQEVHPILPATLGERVNDFMLKMLHKDPKEPLDGNGKSARDIKSHPFLRGIIENKLRSKR
uniref:Protein kinase domain-containing protein n=1 Tax=Glossina pallidipes TaxID=7398 RepID=A0A1A9ZQ59_GLOPL